MYCRSSTVISPLTVARCCRLSCGSGALRRISYYCPTCQVGDSNRCVQCDPNSALNPGCRQGEPGEVIKSTRTDLLQLSEVDSISKRIPRQ